MRYLLCLLVLLIALTGCGGGGGGNTGGGTGATITGRVLRVDTGGATNPPASVQVGSRSTLTSVVDGSFSLAVPPGTTSVLVDTQSSLGVFTFTFPAASGTQDVGDLWVGPEKVTLSGRVLDSTN